MIIGKIGKQIKEKGSIKEIIDSKIPLEKENDNLEQGKIKQTTTKE